MRITAQSPRQKPNFEINWRKCEFRNEFHEIIITFVSCDLWRSMIVNHPKNYLKLFKHLSHLVLVKSDCGISSSDKQHQQAKLRRLIISREKKSFRISSLLEKSRLEIDSQSRRSFHSSQMLSTTMRKKCES